MQFDFAVVHVLGKSNVAADALSRRPDLATAIVDTMVQGAAMLLRVQVA